MTARGQLQAAVDALEYLGDEPYVRGQVISQLHDVAAALDALLADAVRAEEQRDVLREAAEGWLAFWRNPTYRAGDTIRLTGGEGTKLNGLIVQTRAALSSSSAPGKTPTHSVHPTHYCITCGSADGPGPGCGNCRGTGFDQTPCRACDSAPGEEQNR